MTSRTALLRAVCRPIRRPACAATSPTGSRPSFERAFGDAAAEEGAALARRAPGRSARQHAEGRPRKGPEGARRASTPSRRRCRRSGVRMPAPEGPAGSPNVEAETGHGKRLVRSAGRGLADRRADRRRRRRASRCSILCAGAGGKTLALAAGMRNTGPDLRLRRRRPQRLRPIFERLKRAGVRNAQVLQAGDEAALAALGPRFDLVLRRRPLHGHGRLAPPARCQVAAEARQPARSARRSSARVLDLARGAGQARRPRSSTSPARCCRRRMATRSPRSSRTIPTSRRCRGASRGVAGVGSEPPRSADGSERHAAAHAGAPRHRRLLHRGSADEEIMTCGDGGLTMAACMKSSSSTDKSLTGKFDRLRIAFC